MSIEKARSYYKKEKGQGKLNCAQSVVMAFKEKFGVEDSLVDSFKDFGSGRAPGGECGAYYAVKRILSGRCPDRVMEYEVYFSERAGSTKCKEIRQLKKLSCAGCVEAAAVFADNVE